MSHWPIDMYQIERNIEHGFNVIAALGLFTFVLLGGIFLAGTLGWF